MSYNINENEGIYEGEEYFLSVLSRTTFVDSYIFHQPSAHALCTQGRVIGTVKKSIPSSETLSTIGIIHMLQCKLKQELPTLFSTDEDSTLAIA